MKVQTVSYGRTKSKNYQSTRVEVEVSLEPGETFDEALATAKALVDMALGDGPTPEEITRAREVIDAARGAEKALTRMTRSFPGGVSGA